MKILLVLATIFIFSVCAFCEIQQPAERCSPEDFIISPWGGEAGDGDLYNYEEFFKDCYDVGFNHCGFAPISKLSAVRENHLKTDVGISDFWDNNIKDTEKKAEDACNKAVQKLSKEDMDTIYRFFIKDEPSLKDAEELGTYSKAIQKIIKKQPYINLYPDYAGIKTLGCNYPEYLKKILDICQLNYISYDNYSIFADRGLDEDRFYQNLEMVRNECMARNIYFINVILSINHFNYAPIDNYCINVQGWSTLAYGGKGLTYFKFHNAIRGNYRDGAYDRYGNKTNVWYAMRNMNFAIHNIMPYYKNLKNINVYHIGNVPNMSRGAETAQVVESVQSYVPHLNITVQPNLLIGEFVDKDGNPYAIIVNKDQKYSVKFEEFKFKGCKSTKVILDYSIKNKERDFEKEFTWLAPGYGYLLKGVK